MKELEKKIKKSWCNKNANRIESDSLISGSHHIWYGMIRDRYSNLVCEYCKGHVFERKEDFYAEKNVLVKNLICMTCQSHISHIEVIDPYYKVGVYR